MKNRICPRYKKCKEVCYHKTVHEVEDGCGYKCTPNGKIVNCRQATMGEIIIANF
jgi:hypothetical protein